MISTASFKQISAKDLIAKALKNPESRIAGQWLKESRQKVIQVGKYPTRSQLIKYKLTEAEWLVLTGFICTVPGGGASPLAFALLKQQLANLSDQVVNRNIYFPLLIHGSAVLPENYTDQLTSESTSEIFLHRLNLLHSETSCEITGDSAKTRQLLFQNIDLFRKQFKLGNIFLSPIEALTGMRNNQYPLESIDAFSVHNCSDITFYLHPSNKGLSAKQFNDHLREVMDRGNLIIGVACSDTRQGIGQNPYIEQINLKEIGKKIGCDETFAKWQQLGQNGFPIGTFLIGEHQELMTLTWWLQTRAEAIAKNTDSLTRRLTPTRPLFINVPKGFMSLPEGKKLAEQLRELVSNLDLDIYQKRNTRSFIKVDGKIMELSYTDGLQLVLPDGETGNFLEKNVKLSKPGLRNFDFPNRKPLFYLPWGKRSLGPKISDIT